MDITIEQIKHCVHMMKRYQFPPLTVKNKKQARKLTRADLFGNKWHPGDKYYRLLTYGHESAARYEP